MGCGASANSEALGHPGASSADIKRKQIELVELVNEGDVVQLQLGDGQELELGLQWMSYPGAPTIDLDACAICLGADGQVVDAAFYNQMFACGGAVVHSGDNKTGEGDGDDELIKVDVETMPRHGSCTIILCVFAYKGGALQDMDGVKVFLRGKTKGRKQISELAKMWLTGKSAGDGATGSVVAAVYSPDKGRTWCAKRLGSPCPGINFQEGIDTIRDCAFAAGVVCTVPPEATLVTMDKTFNMEKGDLAEIPLDLFREGDDVFIGLGWTCPANLDLDASVVVKRRDSTQETIVNYQCLKYGRYITHRGDNTTGVGDGDDEVIKIDLDTMPSHVESLWVVVNIYSSGRTFQEVKDSYVRLCAAKNGHTLARYKLDGSLSSRGIVFCKLLSGGPKTWYMEALGQPCDGPTAYDASVKRVCGITS